MNENIYFNGEIISLEAARIDPRDRGFLLGDGVFETLLFQNGELLWLDDHLQRLRQSAETMQINLPFDFKRLSVDLSQLCRDSGYRVGSLRLTVTRGVPVSRKLWPVEAAVPTIMARVTELGESRIAEAIKLVTVTSVQRNERSPLARIKSLNYGEAILARIEAEQKGGDDALILNHQGEIASGSVGNVFLRLTGQWFTPPESAGLLAGLARQRLMTLLEAEERVLTPKDSASASQAFISNSLHLTPVAELDDRPLEPLSLESLAARLYR